MEVSVLFATTAVAQAKRTKGIMQNGNVPFVQKKHSEEKGKKLKNYQKNKSKKHVFSAF